MHLLILSFISGILTVLTPCVLPMLPVIIGSASTEKSRKGPFIIIISLAASLFIFTFLLKATTLFIKIDPVFWQLISGVIIILIGFFMIFPKVWEYIAVRLNLSAKTQPLLEDASSKNNKLKNILVGISLGPVFSSCSPTYAIILATVLPVSIAVGLTYLTVYILGLSLMMLAIAIFGRNLVNRLKWASNPNGAFKKVLGILILFVGLAIISGYDKKLQAAILDIGYLDSTGFEYDLIKKFSPKSADTVPASEKEQNIMLNVKTPIKAPEIRDITHWINSEGETFENLRGKVVLIDFWTYSCINCIRTLPFLKQWHEKYSNSGLVIIGVHAPEFAFERDVSNVEKAVKDFEIKYPIAMDNNFSTWRAFNNVYWPAKYFIDRNGLIRHVHFGEGEYVLSEQVIQFLLEENGNSLPTRELESEAVPSTSHAQTPETYLGYQRIENFSNIDQLKRDEIGQYSLVNHLAPHHWTIQGSWLFKSQDLLTLSEGAILKLKFSAKEVYLVMGAQNRENTLPVGVSLNGQFISETDLKGQDINDFGNIMVNESKLYRIIKSDTFLENAELELIFPAGVVLNAFTFGS